MWAAVSFVFILIVVGTPLWWKTTEVQRSSFYDDKIQNLNPERIFIGMNIFISCEYPNRMNLLKNHLQQILSNSYIYKITIKPFKIDIDNATVDIIESSQTLKSVNAGNLLLVEVPSLPNETKILLSNNRIIYFTKETDHKQLGYLIRDDFLLENEVQNKITSVVSPQNLRGNTSSLDSLRASLAYDIVFTVINSDPENVNLAWDVNKDINHYLQPLFDQISHASTHSIKSQWLYLMDLGERPKKDGDKYFLSFSQLPHIISPLEKKLGSGISKNPCVHLIIFTVSCKFSPMAFLTDSGSSVDSMISPQWGAVQILNPSKEHCESNKPLVPNSEKIMATFTHQLHTLLGVRGKHNFDNHVNQTSISGSLLHSWELDSLYRIRTVEHITSASLTLQSLSKLLGEINNIVINEEVATAINKAVVNLMKASTLLKQAELIDALSLSREAYSSAEKAFSDPSLLALLYFPDDQKYAVYIPLFLPIMIPVLMSLKKIHLWLFK